MDHDTTPVIVWLRRDLRLSDHAALTGAAATGRPVLPVFIGDETVGDLGAAAQWRLGQGVDALHRALKARGLRLILRRGKALDVLRALASETGAGAVYWTRLYDPAAIARDREVKTELVARGIAARSFPGHVLFEPWSVETGSGTMFRVYTPFWKAVRGRAVADLLPEPRLIGPAVWPDSDSLQDWRLGKALGRGATVLAQHATIGEDAAIARLERFVHARIADYAEKAGFSGATGHFGIVGKPRMGRNQRRALLAGRAACARGRRAGGRTLSEGTGLARFCVPSDLSHAAYCHRKLASGLGCVWLAGPA